MVKNSSFNKRCQLVRCLVTSGMLVPAMAYIVPLSVQAQTVSYAGPLVITKGGTYTGNYQSLTTGTACVRVATNEPVVLDGCQLAGAGNLIEAGQGVNLTVRNCRGQALTPTVDNQAPGRFLDTYMPQSLVVEHNTFTGTTGIGVNRWSGAGTSGQTLTIRYNQARNIDGRWRNGGSTHSSFVLLNTVQHLAGVEVAFNEVINAPDQSLVEDNINLYNSSGTAQSPLRVHDNFVRGAYPIPAISPGFSGSGMTTDGDATTVSEAASYIEADHNQFISMGNAAMNIAAGHDIYYHENRLVSSGYLADGRQFPSGYTGLGVSNFYKQPAGVFGNNRVENNTIGFVRWGDNAPYPNRQDEARDACAPCNGTIHLPNSITPATEDNEWQLWQQKLQQNNIVVGPTTAGATPPVVATGKVVNPGFELDGVGTGTPTGWQKTLGAGTSPQASYTESYTGGHTGTYHGTHYRPEAYEAYTYQVVSGLANGTYAFSAWVKSSGGQSAVQLRASNYGGPLLNASIGATAGGVTAPGWALVTVPNIVVTNGQCEIGFYSNAGGGGQAIYFDDVTLNQQQNTPPTVSLTASANLSLGQPLTLNATATDSDGTIAKITFFNGTTKLGETTTAPYQLSWTPTSIGLYSLTAVATDDDGSTTTSAAVPVLVVLPILAPTAPTAPGANLVINPGFELDGVGTGTPTGWQKTLGAGTSAQASYTESYAGAHTGAYHGTHYRPDAYEAYTYQVVTGLANGTYAFSAWVKSSGGQSAVQLRASNYGGPLLNASIGATAGGVTAPGWALVTIPNIVVTNGQCEIGFYSNAAGGGQAIYFDDVTLVAQVGSSTATNSLLNASFEDDQASVQSPQQWTTQTWGNTPASVSYVETYGGGHTGAYHGTHYALDSYRVYTYQTVSGLANGTYSLSAWVKSSSGQPKVQLQANNYGKGSSAVDIPGTPNGQWVQVTIPNIVVSNGQCEVGFYSQANRGGQSMYFDDVALVRQDASNAKSAFTTEVETAAVPSLYPNPANDQVTITTSFAQASEVTLVVTDLQGTLIAKYNKQAVAGTNQFSMETSNLASGIYILQILSNGTSSVQHLEVRH
jgi:hypothetical protein